MGFPVRRFPPTVRFRVRSKLASRIGFREIITRLVNDNEEIEDTLATGLWLDSISWPQHLPRAADNWNGYILFAADKIGHSLLEVELLDDKSRYMYVYNEGVSRWFWEPMTAYDSEEYSSAFFTPVQWLAGTRVMLLPMAKRTHRNLHALSGGLGIYGCDELDGKHRHFDICARLPDPATSQGRGRFSMAISCACGERDLFNVLSSVLKKWAPWHRCHLSKAGKSSYSESELQGSGVKLYEVCCTDHQLLWVQMDSDRQLHVTWNIDDMLEKAVQRTEISTLIDYDRVQEMDSVDGLTGLGNAAASGV